MYDPSRIKKLSPLLINQLSAGEVVTRPASVIKELLENAIDSQATNITINITKGGMGLIEVVDNGCGIHPDDVSMAVTRHATSKVADIEHLYGIDTLGFRGEALASISAVSRFTLVSSHDDSGIGRCLTLAGHVDKPVITPIVCAQGTKVSIRDLYFNVPARRGNLKSPSTEYAHIEQIIRNIALVYTNVELTLYNEGKCRLKLSADDSTQRLLPRLTQSIKTTLPEMNYPLFIDLSILQDAVKSYDVDNDLVDEDNSVVSQKTQQTRAEGWFWHKKDREHTQDSKIIQELPKLIYINSRLVKDKVINQKIRSVCQNLAIDYSDIGYALFFFLPSDWLNLNVHPSKQRVSIHALANIVAHLETNLKELLKPLKTCANNKKTNTHVTNDACYNATNASSATEYEISESVDDNSLQSSKKLHNKPAIDNTSMGYEYKPLSTVNVNQVRTPDSIYEISNTPSRSSQSPASNSCSGYCLELTLHDNTTGTEKTNNIEACMSTLQQILNVLETEITYTNNNNTSSNVCSIQSNFSALTCDNQDAGEFSHVNEFSEIEALIATANKICSPWLVLYDDNNRTIQLKFNSTLQSEFKQPEFKCIEQAHIYLL